MGTNQEKNNGDTSMSTLPGVKPIFYDCEICGHFHPWDWDGDCRDDANRFSYTQLDAKYGANGYEIRDMEERIAADLGEYE